MLYKIDRQNNSELENSFLLLESSYSKTDMLSLIAALQHYTEELFGDPDILLNFDCLKHILCRFFHADDVLDCYRSLVSKITLQADSADTACHDYFFDSGLQIIQINRFLVKDFFNAAEYDSNIMQWLPDNPDEEKNLRELIFKEGLE